ncbi:MAG TPA: HAD hydrolase-like protein [Gammaproteobacteria bacterium]|nr:HAD hydrolase-like protein [Gammaproteobacteria bacterium]
MYLLFDFDGTLVDSFNCVVEKTILLSQEFNFRKIEQHEVEGLRDLSSSEIVRFLKVPVYQIPKLIYHMRKHLYHEMKNLSPVENICPVLEKLAGAHFSMGILTSNSVENVSMWLDLHKMSHFFEFIHTESRYFSKKYLLKKTIKKYKIDKSQAFYIGDETRDMDAAGKNGIQSVAVTWGYNSEKTLLQCQPLFVARNPGNLLTIFGL